MDLLFSQVLNGIAIGQIYAMIALGFCLISGVANVINFAQGSLFMLGAFLALSGLEVGMPIWLAALLSTAVTTLCGLLLERVALRPLIGHPYVAPFLSTIAISVVVEQAATIVWSPDAHVFPGLFDDYTLFIGGAYVTGTDIAISCICISACVALTAFLKWAWHGKALRAAAQDPEAASQIGVNTNFVRQAAFGLAGALGAIGGILTAFYFQSVFPQMGLPFGLKGFAAAVIGGISSIPGAIVGGLLLGIAEAVASGYIGDSYRDAIAFCLLLLVLLLRPNGLLGVRALDALGGRGAAGGSMPTTSILAAATGGGGATKRFELGPRALLMAAAVIGVLVFFVDSNYILQVCAYGFIFAMLSASVSIYSGTAGMLSLGHAAFFGVGAYTIALVAPATGLPLEMTLVLCAVVGGSIAAIATIPLKRLSPDTIALGTLAVGQIGFTIFLNWIDVTRGPMGISDIPRPVVMALGGMEVRSAHGLALLSLAVLAILVIFARRLTSSSVGNVLRAIREDRLAAVASGIPTGRYLLVAAASSGAIAAVAGGMFAYVQTIVSPEMFTVQTSVTILAMAVLGGLGNMTGAAVSGFVLAVAPEFLRGFSDYRMIAYGALLLVALRVRPQGIFGAR